MGGRRGRRRPRDARQGTAGPAAAGARRRRVRALDARVAARARRAHAPRARGVRRRRDPLVRGDPPRPGAPLPGRLRAEPQPAALHLDDPQPPRPAVVLPGSALPRSRPVVRAARAGARAHGAARVDARPPGAALAAGAARLLLRRRLQAAGLHPSVHRAPRDPDGPRRRPADPRGDDARALAVRPRRRTRRAGAGSARGRRTRGARAHERAALALGRSARGLVDRGGLPLLAPRRARPRRRAARAACRRRRPAAAPGARGAADPRPPRVGPGALHPRDGPRGDGVGRLAHGVDGRLLLQRRSRAPGRRRERGARRGRARPAARAGGAR